MPLFEYSCDSCHNRFTLLVGMVAGSGTPQCPDCGAGELTKLVSRFSVVASHGDSLDDMADLADPCDPSSMKELVDGVKDELGDDAGEDLAQMIEQC